MGAAGKGAWRGEGIGFHAFTDAEYRRLRVGDVLRGILIGATIVLAAAGALVAGVLSTGVPS